MPKVLLHTCCAPCTTYVSRWFIDNDLDVTGFFYNPNIQPLAEHNLRQETMKKFAALAKFEVIYGEGRPEMANGEWRIANREWGMGNMDCKECYRIRLEETAKLAKEKGFDCFSTTLLVSPYQKHELIREIAGTVCDKIGVDFFYQDFRIGFRESQMMARSLGLYRQKYCGCGKDLKKDNVKTS